MSKLKLGYAPSKSEFYLLTLLAVVAIAALSLNYLILPQWASFQESRQEYGTQTAVVENLRAEYAKLEDYKLQEADLAVQLGGMEGMVPTYLSEEELLVSLDETAADSGLTLTSIAFGGVQDQAESAFFASLSPDKGSAAGSGGNESSGGSDKSTVESEQLVLNFSGSYDQLHKFLSGFESRTRKVFFQSMSASQGTDGSLSGTLNLLAFSASQGEIPADYPGYPFDAPVPSGKENPFAAAVSAAQGGEGTAPSASVTHDFYIILNTYDDNASKIYMGKYPASSVQLTSDTNGTVQAILTLGCSGKAYTYTYTLGGRSRSGSFTPAEGQGALSVSVFSRTRKSSADKVGMTLSVKNETDLPVNIYVNNEDSANPRFALGTTLGSVRILG